MQQIRFSLSIFVFFGVIQLFIMSSYAQKAAPLSEDTQACLDCHNTITQGILSDWKGSLHSQVSPAMAMRKSTQKRRVSASHIPDKLKQTVVGCAECHTLNPETHRDTFEHNGYQVHVVVTPKDCAICHPDEESQFQRNIMSKAHENLDNNPIFRDLANSVNGAHTFESAKVTITPPHKKTEADSCFHCHGTTIKVESLQERETPLGGMKFPLLSGWPNQGVGRVNPDGSTGSCTSCHARHQFSIEMARKPYTCAECHKGPDVPAYKVYMVSKHGNIYASLSKRWNFNKVPWTIGKDFTAPTCAVCHVSFIVDEEGNMIAQRTHQMNDRLSWRIFGLIYAHAHPKSPDTTIIINKQGLPLPTELTGEPVSSYLVDFKEQEKRRNILESVCVSCHSKGWVDGHFARFENTIQMTNEMTLTATKILIKAWEHGIAQGLDKNDSMFNEAIEKKWVEQWLFFANSTRFASAMAGADYGVFANGRWHMSKNIQEMMDLFELKRVRGMNKEMKR